MFVDLMVYQGYVGKFLGTSQELVDEIEDRLEGNEELSIDDEPFEYTSFLYGGDTYKRAVKEYVQLDTEYNKQNKKILMIMLPGVIIGILMILALPKFAKLLGVLVLVGTLIFTYFQSQKFKNIKKPEFYRDKLLGNVLNGMGGINSINYTSTPDIKSGEPSKSLFELRKQMLSMNDRDYIRKLLVDLGVSGGSGLKFDFDSSMVVDYGGQTGRMVKLESTHEEQTKDSDGKTQTRTVQDLDGFALLIDGDYSGSLSDGEKLVITPQGGYLSKVAEDTKRNLMGSKKEYVFNLEELNEELNCKLVTRDTDGDSIQEKLQKIMSPDFEDFLSFMTKRYGQFSMVVMNDCMQMVVNVRDRYGKEGLVGLVKDIFSKGVKGTFSKSNAKDFTRDHFDKVIKKGNSDIYERFQYWSLFPLLDTAYTMRSLSKYVSYTMDTQRIDTNFLQSFDSYRLTMEDLALTEFTEFKKTVKDEFGSLKD